MSVESQVREVLGVIKGADIDICAEIYKIMEAGRGREAEILQFFFENSEKIKSSGEREADPVFTKGEIQDYTKRYGELADGILKKVLDKKPGKPEFYQELWENISVAQIFENRKAMIFAVYYIWIDARIPYFELPESISIEKDEYMSIKEELIDKIQEARFILASDFKRWTEVSHLLLKLLDEIDDDKKKAVFLACIMQIRDKFLIQQFLHFAIER